jgi:rRNA maturation RNase YbeY
MAVGEINFVFCNDSYLLDLNRKFKKHSFLTDILTFPGDGPGLSGDIFISVERVRENAPRYEAVFEDELHRVMVHGLLHLAGYPDKTALQKAKMRRKETRSLSLR